jgi:hypothetical protein
MIAGKEKTAAILKGLNGSDLLIIFLGIPFMWTALYIAIRKNADLKH